MKPFRLTIAATVSCVVFIACETPGVRLIDPEVDDDPARTVTVTVRLEDAALADALGWEQGVPAAVISYYRIGEEARVQNAETDSNGRVQLQGMLPGQYRIAAYRVLHQDETGATAGLVRAFGDGLTVWIYPPQDLEMALRRDHAGSLVISEVRGPGRYEGLASGWPDYNWFGYFEVYNNSETTIYLDGMLWGQGFIVYRDGVNSCESTEPFRNDSLGIWTWYFHQFPGNGNDHPLASGQTAVVALDAVDHSAVHPSLPDLSNADFELEGVADADNPDVPNMPQVGPAYNVAHGHGVPIECYKGCFLAQPTNLESLVRQRDPFFSGENDWVRIPVESVLDVVTTDIWNPAYDYHTPCGTKVHRSFDGLEVPLHEVFYDVSIAMQRKVLRMGATGFPLLQDVNVSFVDFFLTKRSPGWIEY